MILSDAGVGLGTLAVALLLFTDQLQVWHIYLITAISSTLGTFQWPAYTAATTLLVPKEHYGRASGMIQLAHSVAPLVAPALAGLLIVGIGIVGVFLIDFATFLFAILTLLLVRFPRPEISAEGAEAQGSLVREAVFGWTYIAKRPGLLGLLMLYAATSFLGITTEVMLTPYLLSFASASVLGFIVSATGAGLLVGGLVMSIWGGPKRRIYGIVGFEMLVAICTVLIGMWPSILIIGVAVFAYFVFIALADGCSQALWQSKVTPDFQGRVFAMRRMISWSALPLGILITAPLAEYVFEPLLDFNGPWTGSIGKVIGVGPGRGIGLLFIITGIFNVLVLVASYLYPRVRLVEDEVPDAIVDAVPAA
jgi:MFS family permease